MKHIKLFENFDVNRLSDNIEGILVELNDYGFRYKVDIYDEFIDLSIRKSDSSDFIYNEVKDYILTIIDYYEGLFGSDLDISYEYKNIVKMYGNEHFITNKSEPKDDKSINVIECVIFNNEKR